MATSEPEEGCDRPRESCGVCGVIGVADAAAHVYRGLFSLQHRGQEGAGIVASDGEEIRSIKGQGLLTTVFAERDFQRELPGYLAIGHVRYSTTGLSKPYNVQPLVVGCRDGIWAVAHNGNLTNAHLIRSEYQDRGAIFQTSTDSEVLLHIIADPEYRDRPRRVERALARLRGAFAFLLMTRDSLMAARDPHGFRPLCIGKLWNGYIVASETCALEQVGATYLRDVEPGELVTISARGLSSTHFADGSQRVSQCIFEHVYFARPDSMVFGENVHEVRLRLGRRLAQEHPVDADVVVPVPDSGLSAALGFSQESGIPLDYGFIRNHYIGRTFIMPQAELRDGSVDMKLAVVSEVVRGKRVVVVDDSIVRGTTCRRRVKTLRRAGAREVHMRISCPPTRHPCFFGIDFPTREELIAARHSLEDICRFIGADSLGYVSMEGLLAAVSEPGRYCTACFSGDYPEPVESGLRKDLLETR